MDNNKHIEELIERFLDGYTSNREEQELYEFFTKEEIPENLIKYKSIFSFLSGMNSTTVCFHGEEKHILPIRSKQKIITWISIAASFLLIIGTSFFFFRNIKPDPFEGSYIIRNGEKITDLNLIRPELEATLHIALEQEEQSKIFIKNNEDMRDYYDGLGQRIINEHKELLNLLKK